MGFIDRWNNMMHLWSENPYDDFPPSIVNKFSPSSLPQKIKLIIKDLTADFIRFFKVTNIPESKIWFLVLTKNNLDSLKEIKDITPNSIFTSFFRFRSTIDHDDTYYFHLSRRILYDLTYPIYWLVYLFNNRRKGLRYYDLLITAHGSFEESVRLLKKCKPKAIVFTNDHMVTARAMLLAANSLGVKTYYVQHAAVSSKFPPLEFTHAILEGEQSLLQYEQCGEVKSQIHLCGMPKFDKYAHQLNVSEKATRIGIAFNLIDDIKEISIIANHIKNTCSDLEIIIRPHPAEDRNLESLENFKISDSNRENAFDFLSRIDSLVAAESSIHLEAVLLNVYPLHINFGDNKLFDNYGFVADGLIEHYSSKESLVEKIKELSILKPSIQAKAKNFNAAIGSDFYGASANKISKIILETINVE